MAKNGGGRIFFSILMGVIGAIACGYTATLGFSVVDLIHSGGNSGDAAAGAVLGAIVLLPVFLITVGAYLVSFAIGLPCSVSLAKRAYGKKRKFGIFFSILFAAMFVIVAGTTAYVFISLGAGNEAPAEAETAMILSGFPLF